MLLRSPIARLTLCRSAPKRPSFSDHLTRTGPDLGGRLWIIYFENPLSPRELLKSARDLLPKAHIVEAEDGPISRPDITAGVVRKLTAPLRASAGDR